ncbi:MAG: hypothetical protein GF364_12620 [Candidatus Lokiarchaeota archaeon]|nr:hypothetical protein [Candidatus Lokiarchaeota archaeon]
MNIYEFLTNICPTCAKENELYNSICNCGSTLKPSVNMGKMTQELNELVRPGSIILLIEELIGTAFGKIRALQTYVKKETLRGVFNNIQGILGKLSSELQIKVTEDLSNRQEALKLIHAMLVEIKRLQRKAEKICAPGNPIQAKLKEYSDLYYERKELIDTLGIGEEFEDKLKPRIENVEGKLDESMAEIRQIEEVLGNIGVIKHEYTAFSEDIEFLESLSPTLLRKKLELTSLININLLGGEISQQIIHMQDINTNNLFQEA